MARPPAAAEQAGVQKVPQGDRRYLGEGRMARDRSRTLPRLPRVAGSGGRWRAWPPSL